MRIPGLLIIMGVCCSLFGQASDTLVWRLTPAADAVISSLDPAANYGRLPELLAQSWAVDGSDYALRTLLRFEWPELPPHGEWISAELQLLHSGGTGGYGGHAGDNAAILQGITGTWSEEAVSWSNQPTTSLAGAVFLPSSIGPQQDYGPLDVTDWVFRDQSRSESSTGFMLQLQSEEAHRGLAFASREHPDSSRHPVLTLRAIVSPPLGNTNPVLNPGSTIAWLSQAPGFPSALRVELAHSAHVRVIHSTILGQNSVMLDEWHVPAGSHEWPISGMFQKQTTGYLRVVIDGQVEGNPIWLGP